MFKEIKTIPLAIFMSRLGHEPARRCGDKLWYRSPLRQEHTPSFKIETSLNCWHDFGLGKGGNIIDLAAEIYQSTDLRYLMRCIADNCPVSSERIQSFSTLSAISTRQSPICDITPLSIAILITIPQAKQH